jgi:C4-dicarboxylate-specific signal transduction histidine kinase
MQTTTREWVLHTLSQLPEKETQQLIDYLEYLKWKTEPKKPEPKQTGAQNPMAQRIIKAMEQPPYVTHEDAEALRQVIKEAKQPTRIESPFEPDEREDNEQISSGNHDL